MSRINAFCLATLVLMSALSSAACSSEPSKSEQIEKPSPPRVVEQNTPPVKDDEIAAASLASSSAQNQPSDDDQREVTSLEEGKPPVFARIYTALYDPSCQLLTLQVGVDNNLALDGVPSPAHLIFEGAAFVDTQRSNMLNVQRDADSLLLDVSRQPLTSTGLGMLSEMGAAVSGSPTILIVPNGGLDLHYAFRFPLELSPSVRIHQRLIAAPSGKTEVRLRLGWAIDPYPRDKRMNAYANAAHIETILKWQRHVTTEPFEIEFADQSSNQDDQEELLLPKNSLPP